MTGHSLTYKYETQWPGLRGRETTQTSTGIISLVPPATKQDLTLPTETRLLDKTNLPLALATGFAPPVKPTCIYRVVDGRQLIDAITFRVCQASAA